MIPIAAILGAGDRRGPELDRHRGHLRPRPFGRSGRARGRRRFSETLRVHQVRARPGDSDVTDRQDASKRIRFRRECEASLKRLNVGGRIDLYQIHWPGAGMRISKEGWEALVRLREAGKVRNIGVSNCNASQLARISKFAVPSSLQPPYSLVTPDIEESILPYCGQHNIGVIVYSPMRNGLLSGTMTRERVRDAAGRRRAAQDAPVSGAELDAATWRWSRKLTRHRQAGHGKNARRSRHRLDAAAVRSNRRDRRPAECGPACQGVIGAADFRLSESEISAESS